MRHVQTHARVPPIASLVRRRRFAGVRPPLPHQANGLRRRGIRRQAGDRHPQHLERPQSLSCAPPRLRAEEVKRGVWQAGGFPVEVPVVSLGETLMKPTTMLYRNLLAMETEELLRANPIDGVVLLGGCDKTVPGADHGCDHDEPACDLRARRARCCAATTKAQTLASGSDVWKYWAERRAGTIDDCTWRGVEDGIARSYGTCMTMGTASTMAAAAEALGLTLPGASSIPAADSAHGRMAAAAGRRIVELVWDDVKPRDLLTPRSLRQRDHRHDVAWADRRTPSCIWSRWHAVPASRWTSITSIALPRRTPVLGDIRPSGRFLMEDFFYAGGLRALDGAARRSARPHGARPSAARRSARRTRSAEGLQRRRHPAARESAIAAKAASRSCAATWRPRRGHQADRRRSASARARGTGRRISRLQRPGGADRRSGAAGHAGSRCSCCSRRGRWAVRACRSGGCCPIPQKLLKAGVRDMVRISRRAYERHGVRHLRAARRARVVRRRAAGAGPRRRRDRARRAGAPAVARGQRRRARASPCRTGRRRALHYPRGYGLLHAQHVLQADEGCDFDFLRDGPPVPEPEIH